LSFKGVSQLEQILESKISICRAVRSTWISVDHAKANNVDFMSGGGYNLIHVTASAIFEGEFWNMKEVDVPPAPPKKDHFVGAMWKCLWNMDITYHLNSTKGEV